MRVCLTEKTVLCDINHIYLLLLLNSLLFTVHLDVKIANLMVTYVNAKKKGLCIWAK